MAIQDRIRARRILTQAEGYLELGLPRLALEALGRLGQPGTFKGHQQYLVGESLRSLERFHEAVDPLREAAELAPSNIQAWLALGWCHKRTGQLDLAIQALQRAAEIDPDEAILHYNLACYQSLDGQTTSALHNLGRAIEMDPQFRDLALKEADFDPLRSEPSFLALLKVLA